MKTIILFIFAAALFYLGLVNQSVNAGEMIKVEKNFASPIISLTGYTKVRIQDLHLSNTVIISPPWIDKDSFYWQVSDNNLVYLKDRFRKDVALGLTENDGRYEIVDREGKGVIVVDVSIISFMPYALKADTEVSTKGTGEFHLSVRLRDGGTRNLIHIFEVTQVIGDDYQPNTEMGRTASAEELFRSWGKSLRKKLDDAN